MAKTPGRHAEEPLIDAAEPVVHPEEIRWAAEFRLPGRSVFRVAARFTPAGVVCGGLLIAGVLLSTAVLARSLRPITD